MGRGAAAVAVVLSVAAASVHAGSLTGVDVAAGSAPSVRLHVTVPVVPVVGRLPAGDGRPARIYLDLPGTSLEPSAPSVVDGAGALLRVRTGQFAATTARVVLDLATAVGFTLHEDDTTVTIALEAPPAPAARAAAPALPMMPPPPVASAVRPMLVVVDAGHGGHDPGATGIGGVVEKAITLDVARRVAERLAAQAPVEIRLTRSDDTFVPIEDRIARAATAALFVSLHANAAADPTLSGVEVFYGGGGAAAAPSGPRSPVRLGLDVEGALGRRLGRKRTTLRPGVYGVVARNAVPSVLVEIGYLTNPGDAARLQDDAYRGLVADAVADGAAAFLRDPATLVEARDGAHAPAASAFP